MQQIALSASRREATGKGAARQMRAGGSVPAIIYSSGKEAEKLSVPVKSLEKVIRDAAGANAFLALSVDDGEPRIALMKDVQTDHLGRKLIHVDFYEVTADQTLTLDIPLNYVGEAPGINQGGIVSVIHHTVTLAGTMKTLPEQLDIDISGLELDQSLNLEQLEIPEGVELITPMDTVLVTCALPKLVEEEEPEEEEGEEGEGEEGEATDAESEEGKKEESGE